MVFGGLVAMFLLPMAIVAAVSSLFPQMQSNDVMMCAMPFIVICVLIVIAGVVYFGLNVRQPMKLYRIAGQFAWFKGVHHDFVAGLPPFPRDPPSQ